MKKRIFLIIIVLAVLCGAAALLLRNGFRSNCVVRPGVVYIPTGSDYAALCDSLEAGGSRIRHRWFFDRYADRLELERTLKPGCYELREGMSVIDVVRMFKLGLQTPVRVSMNNVKTVRQLAGKLSRQIEADSASLVAAFTDGELAARLGFDTLTLFSMFIPDTYEMWWTVAPGALAERMKKEYDRFWTGERSRKLERTGLSRLEAMTLASIVYEETRKSDEMPTVAGVYMNRLRIGMPLQADPTVKYAVGDFSLRRILNKHLKTPSPYNTYLNKGLPPSPICMPSIEAIDAVLDYERHNYIFFCAKEDFSGYHNFAENYSRHLANARRYQAALNARNIR